MSSCPLDRILVHHGRFADGMVNEVLIHGRTEVKDGLVSSAFVGGGATNCGGGTTGASPRANAAENGDFVAAAPWTYPRKGCKDRRRRLGDGETICERISGRRARWPAALGEKGPNQFAGGPSRIARRGVSGTTGLKRGGGGRPHRAIDGDPSRPVTNAGVFEEARIALAANGCHSCPPKKSIEEHVAEQQRFLADELRPRLDAAEAGQGHVFFVDAAHFVFGTFLCCLWLFGRLFVRAASGRQRFNVLGAWNAVTRS